MRFDVDTLQWLPDFRYQRKTELTDTEDSEENDFRAIVLFPPLESRPDGYVVFLARHNPASVN